MELFESTSDEKVTNKKVRNHFFFFWALSTKSKLSNERTNEKCQKTISFVSTSNDFFVSCCCLPRRRRRKKKERGQPNLHLNFGSMATSSVRRRLFLRSTQTSEEINFGLVSCEKSWQQTHTTDSDVLQSAAKMKSFSVLK